MVEEISAKKVNGTLVTIPVGHKAYIISDEKVIPVKETGEIHAAAEAVHRAPAVTTSPTRVEYLPPVVETRKIEPEEYVRVVPPVEHLMVGPERVPVEHVPYHPLSGWSEEDVRKLEDTLKKIYERTKLTPEQKEKIRNSLIRLGHSAKEALHHLWEAVTKHKEVKAKEKLEEVGVAM